MCIGNLGFISVDEDVRSRAVERRCWKNEIRKLSSAQAVLAFACVLVRPCMHQLTIYRVRSLCHCARVGQQQVVHAISHHARCRQRKIAGRVLGCAC